MDQTENEVTKKEPERYNSLLPHWSLVAVTLIIGIGSMILTCDGMKKQVEAMKQQNEAFLRVSNQGIRPYPIISVDSVGNIGMTHRIGSLDTIGDTINAESYYVQEVVIKSHTDKAKTLTNVFVENVIYKIKNNGRLPMYITGQLKSAELQSEWKDSIKGDCTKLCQNAASSKIFSILETDLTILPGDSIMLKPTTAIRTMKPSEFEKYRDVEHRFVFYPYLYIQYEDPFNKKYDALLMWAVIFNLDTTLNEMKQPVTSITKQGILEEKNRWDILLSPDR